MLYVLTYNLQREITICNVERRKLKEWRQLINQVMINFFATTLPFFAVSFNVVTTRILYWLHFVRHENVNGKKCNKKHVEIESRKGRIFDTFIPRHVLIRLTWNEGMNQIILSFSRYTWYFYPFCSSTSYKQTFTK